MRLNHQFLSFHDYDVVLWALATLMHPDGVHCSKHAAKTHQGAPSRRSTSIQQLQRTVMSCLLWEDQFYEDGVSIADRIKDLVHRCDATHVMNLAIAARNEGKLRHVPLLLMRELARHKQQPKIADALAQIIQRPDELCEYLSIYYADNENQSLSKQSKLGLDKALRKFDEYQLAKYNRPGKIKLKDVLRLIHPVPEHEEQEALWNRVIDDTLVTPDTWEVALSRGADKKKTFTRLLVEQKLGYLALLRNLRNMTKVGVEEQLVRNAIVMHPGKNKVLPFQFIAAARVAKQFMPSLDLAMQSFLRTAPKLKGTTILLVDVSGSMAHPLSKRSKLSRLDAGLGLAALVRGVTENCRIYSFSESLVEVYPDDGFALMSSIANSQPHGNTYLGTAMSTIDNRFPSYDRLIVITDEQSSDKVPVPHGQAYIINVASYKHGIGYGSYTQIDGFSENVIRYIQAIEADESEKWAYCS